MILMHRHVLEPLNESKKGKEMCREQLRDRGTWLMTDHGFQEVMVKDSGFVEGVQFGGYSRLMDDEGRARKLGLFG